jgi:hypothetical protein
MLKLIMVCALAAALPGCVTDDRPLSTYSLAELHAERARLKEPGCVRDYMHCPKPVTDPAAGYGACQLSDTPLGAGMRNPGSVENTRTWTHDCKPDFDRYRQRWLALNKAIRAAESKPE